MPVVLEIFISNLFSLAAVQGDALAAPSLCHETAAALLLSRRDHGHTTVPKGPVTHRGSCKAHKERKRGISGSNHLNHLIISLPKI